MLVLEDEVQFFTPLLYWAFGALVGGTVGLCVSGLLANLLTLQIFDRRPLADIGLQFSSAAGRNTASAGRGR